MYYISTIYCSKCKAVGVPLIKYNKRVYKKIRTTQYHYCRECTAERLKDYYHTKGGSKKVKKAAKKYLKSDAGKYKQRARIKLNAAVKDGTVKKPSKCSVCKKAKKIQGHHTDYSKPLDVVWVCAGCHSDIETGNKQVHSGHKCTLYDIFKG